MNALFVMTVTTILGIVGLSVLHHMCRLKAVEMGYPHSEVQWVPFQGCHIRPVPVPWVPLEKVKNVG
jgi:hypothetical protein